MKEKVNIKDKSFDGAGLKKDYIETIIEYILNGFEAHATEVSISAQAFSNTFNGLKSLEIIDNGSGINYETREETFGSFLISQKQNNVFFDRVNKGKGRYTFSNICGEAKWTTVYKKGDKNYKYTITIRNCERDYCNYTEPVETDETTGTKVEFFGLGKLKIENLEGEDFKQQIAAFFAKYLYLHKDKHIFLNGIEIPYSLVIDDSLSSSFTKTIDNFVFKIDFIKWIEGSNQKSFAYYVDQSYVEKFKEHTKCNNNAVKFYHSVFIESTYFDDFSSVGIENGFEYEKTQTDKVFKELQTFIFDYVKNRLKEYIQTEVPRIVQSYIDDGLFPDFADDPIANAQKEDLKSVVSSVYCVQPNLFFRTKKDSKKAIIGCLNLILKTDERENIITILDSIQKLSKEEREQLANTLKKYEPSSVVKLLNTISARYEIIEKIKTLVLNNEQFTNERNHIQKIIEQNYWLFGEEYNLVAADERLDKVLTKYLKYLDRNINGINYDDPCYKSKRPDIFISGMRDVASPNGEIQQNIIVELKAPYVKLTFDIYRQIEDYMMAIKKEPEFNSIYCSWKFICVCCELSPEVIDRRNSYNERGKKGLVNCQSNYEIYAYTWSDIFTMFDIRHRHLYGKLQKKANELAMMYNPSRELADRMTNEISDLSGIAK